MFVFPSTIPKIESLSQPTISPLDSGSFGRNISDMNIQQQTTLEVADTETGMDDNEYLDPPSPQDISNVFSLAEFSSRSSFDSAILRAHTDRKSVV